MPHFVFLLLAAACSDISPGVAEQGSVAAGEGRGDKAAAPAEQNSIPTPESQEAAGSDVVPVDTCSVSKSVTA
jgi:hypothetical protein